MAGNSTPIHLSSMSSTHEHPVKEAEMTGISISDLSTERPIGSWLCSEGPYRKYIEALSGSNPGLKSSDPNSKTLRNGNALVVLLDAPATGQPEFETKEFVNVAELGQHFQEASHDHQRHRIYLMEGLAPDFVAAVGGHFFMEPSFFQRQERTCVWSNDFTPVSDAMPQPSLLHPEKTFHLQYCELRRFTKALENRYYFCDRTWRHVGMTPPRPAEDSTTGILRRKVGWWSRETTQGGWDVVILCDPPLHRLSPVPKEFFGSENKLREIQNIDELKNRPFQDGYADFLPAVPYAEIATVVKHPHTSMLRDLMYYYQHKSKLLSADEWRTPTMSAVFLKKIVAAHYLQLSDYIKVMLPSLELRLTMAWVDGEDLWRSLQTISRRCGNYRDDIEDALLSLEYPLDGRLDLTDNMRKLGWKDCQRDFQYAYLRLKTLKERADNLMQAMTGLASMAGNNLNLDEAKRVKRLSQIALVFIPLAYTSSLFSMQDKFAVNQDYFWVYWVVALGIVLCTAAFSWVLDKALNDKAQWTLGFLKFWRKSQPKPKPAITKRTTGIYPGPHR